MGGYVYRQYVPEFPESEPELGEWARESAGREQQMVQRQQWESSSRLQQHGKFPLFEFEF